MGKLVVGLYVNPASVGTRVVGDKDGATVTGKALGFVVTGVAVEGTFVAPDYRDNRHED